MAPLESGREGAKSRAVLCPKPVLLVLQPGFPQAAQAPVPLGMAAFSTARLAALGQACGHVLMQKLAGDSIKKTRKIEILGERGLRNRIMIYLDVLRKKEGSSVVTVKMNREQFAQYLCVSRSALSNELNKMKREKIIDFNKERFEIL